VFRLGLTGSIGMGKSTTAAMFRARGVPVHDADAAVHRLYAGVAAPLIEAAFPGVVRSGVVDRAALAARVVGQGEAMQRLEAIIHPLVRGAETAFLETARQAGAALVLLDIPLLFETGAEGRCDGIVVASCPADMQRARVLARPGMSAEKFEGILARQMPDAEKRRRAHFVVETGLGLEAARRQVDDLLRALSGQGGVRGFGSKGT
jgi:dephospho-CoA kinase